jgi:aspartate ammonia-lyase
VIADALFESGTLLANVCRVFADKCVAGIVADEERCRAYAERSSAIATALNPIIGYSKAAEIVHRALDERRSIIDLVVEERVLGEQEAREVLDPMRLTGPLHPSV